MKYSKDGKVDGKEREGIMSLYIMSEAYARQFLLVTSRGGDACGWRCMASDVS
jgi:hypothetical protein